MRDIKFRGYSNSFNIMFDYDMLQMATAGMVDICNEKLKVTVPESTNIQMGLFLPTEDEDLVLMQYTGLKDKNGKEIYEGDIVNYFRDELAEVKFINGCFVIDSKAYTDSFLGLMGDIEVVGNIYENKEMLKGIRG